MLKKILLALMALLTMGQLAFVALPAGAVCDPSNGNSLDCLQATGLGGNTNPADAGKQLPQLIGRIIRTVLGVLGIVFVVLMVYAGFRWMIARGDSDMVSSAKETIIQATIGLVIIFLAYAITGFVVDAVTKATTAG